MHHRRVVDGTVAAGTVALLRARTASDPSTGTVDARFVNRLERLPGLVSGPGETLWFVSNHADGRGTPAPGDDRLVRVERVEVGR